MHLKYIQTIDKYLVSVSPLVCNICRGQTLIFVFVLCVCTAASTAAPVLMGRLITPVIIDSKDTCPSQKYLSLITLE